MTPQRRDARNWKWKGSIESVQNHLLRDDCQPVSRGLAASQNAFPSSHNPFQSPLRDETCRETGYYIHSNDKTLPHSKTHSIECTNSPAPLPASRASATSPSRFHGGRHPDEHKVRTTPPAWEQRYRTPGRRNQLPQQSQYYRCSRLHCASIGNALHLGWLTMPPESRMDRTQMLFDGLPHNAHG